MELIHVSEVIKDTEFKVFSGAVASGGKVALLNVKGQAENYTRGDIDNLTEFVADFGAKGLAWMKVKGDELTGPLVKFLSDEELSGIKAEENAGDGDLLTYVAYKIGRAHV